LTMGGGAIQGVTYFGADASSPVQLSAGDTLTATLVFTFTNVSTANSSQGFRLGLFDFADSTLSPTWATADLGSNNGLGNGVNGYALFQNFGVTFNNTSPMDIRKRTNVGDSALLGTSGDWTSLATGPGSTGNFPGFTNGGHYSLQFSVARPDSVSLVIAVTWQNLDNGASLTTSVTDSAASTFNFDGIALRPAGASSSATNIIFNEVRVDWVSVGSPAEITSDPASQSVFTNQSANFTVAAIGSAPLSYQWFYNTNTPVAWGTNATLTIINAQFADAGMYSAVVTNVFGADTSAAAALIVSAPVAPSIVTQPQPGTVLPGQDAMFLVQAGGSEPLSYQWFYNTNTPLADAADSILTLTNVQAEQAGTYNVIVSNFVGSVTSDYAMLSINTNPVAPAFTRQPASQTVLVGGTASFTVLVAGTAPIYFQWFKNGAGISGQTNAALTLNNVQLADAGSYTVVASNSVGPTASSAAVLTVTPSVPIVNSAYDLVGYGRFTTGGGGLPDTDPNYAKVWTATDLANALNSKTVKVIEIMTNLNLGYNEIEASAKANSEPFRADSTPLLHPVLLTSGVSIIDVQKKNGLTIFSANGATIRHAHLNVKHSGNIIIRNLKFDELWEWDEASKGKYDKNNWDFITVGDAGTVSNLWIDHCTFTKAYDGEVDIKQGSYNLTISWCKYAGDDGATNPDSWVWQQINSLESNRTSYAFYNFLRNNGFSTTDIVTIVQGHDKTHLIGANDLDPQNAQHSVTLHHEWFMNPWDRLPRLRAGNVHDFNIYVDDTAGLAAKRLRDARAAAMSAANRNTLNNTYSFNPFLNGSISTEGGAVLVEKSVYIDCLTPLRNNQTDPSNPVYTGKILALDTIYQFDNTVIRGNSTDPGNPLGPFQAPIIPFSWNTNSSTPDGRLPYTYTPDDPGQLAAIITSATAGAGAGVLHWDKTNWLMTTYAPTAPFIVASPQNQTNVAGQTAVFSVTAGGSTPLNYQWYFNTNSILAGATNSTLALSNLQNTNAGAYVVVVSNSVGAITSEVATLDVTVSGATFQSWQQANFTAGQLADPSISGPGAAPAGDGVANFIKYALGLPPFVAVTNSLVGFQLENGEGVLSYVRPADVSDVIYQVQVSTDLLNWATNGVSLQLAGMDVSGSETWTAHYKGAASRQRFFRLVFTQ
jgi:pectate lyase